MLVSTVGPFTKWGEPAVRAAITGHAAAYIDSTGEPAFIRRVFQNHGPIAKSGRCPAADRDGLRLRAGRAGGRAGARGGGRGRRARRRRLLRARDDHPERQHRHAGVAGGRLAGREPRLPRRRAAQRPHRRARAIVPGQGQGARRRVGRRRRAPGAPGRVSAAAGGQRLPRLVRPVRAADAGGGAGRLGRHAAPGRARGADVRRRAAGGAGRGPRGRHDAGRRVLDRGAGVRRRRAISWPRSTSPAATGTRSPPTSSPGRRAPRAGGRVKGAGALGPVEAFGLEELERGCALAGLSRATV